MKKICMAVMAICMLVACGNEQQEVQTATEETAITLSGLKSENSNAVSDSSFTVNTL